MKKLVTLLLSLLMLLSAACAQDMGVQLIGGPTPSPESTSLDDFHLQTPIEIEGWGIVEGIKYSVVDIFKRVYRSDTNWTEDIRSGNEAQYVILQLDILNTALKGKNFLESFSVKLIYDEVYEYGGWGYQVDTNRNTEAPVTESMNFPIDPMYEGHYWFGCTLPNAIIESTKPLQMIITIDQQEIIYNIRK